jgi:hypothetical protein
MNNFESFSMKLLGVLLMLMTILCFIFIGAVLTKANAQTYEQNTSITTIPTEGYNLIDLQLGGEVAIYDGKSSRIIIEKTVTIKGHFNNSKAVYAALANQGAFDNIDVVDDIAVVVIKALKPEKTYIVNGKQVEVTQTFKVWVPAGVKVLNL